MYFFQKRLEKCGKHLLFIFLGILLSYQSISQQARTEGDMHELKWWLGIKSGMNFLHPKPSQEYSILTQKDASVGTKTYKTLFKNSGAQIGVTAGHAFTSFLSVTIQPTIFFNKYNYSTTYKWVDTSGNKTNLNFNFRQTLYYLDLPLMARLGWKVNSFQLFAQGGGFYDILLNSNKKYSITENNTVAGTAYDSEESERIVNNKQAHIKSMVGLLVGGGVAYDIEWFRVVIEVNYRVGFSNTTNVKKRYEDNLLLASAYDVPDDLRLSSVEISLSCIVPLDNLVHVTKSTKPKKLSKPGK